MDEERPRRRHRRRRDRTAVGGVEVTETASTRRSRAAPDWQWRTFPVLFAFALGIVLMGLAAATELGLAVFIVGLLGAAFGVAHIIGQRMIARRGR